LVDNHSGLLVQCPRNNDLLEYLLLRRLAATLGQEGINKIFGGAISPDKIHPLGFYVCPPLQEDNYEMGDVVKKNDDNSFHVVLTPSCDLVRKGADFLLLVPTIPLKNMPEYIKFKKNQNEPNKDNLIKVIESRGKDRFFFLPRNEFIGMFDAVLDFQQGVNHKFSCEDRKLTGYQKVAKLDDPFAQDMLASFVRNKNRPGSPDIDSDHVLNYLCEEIKAESTKEK